MAGRGARVALLGIRCDRGSSFMRGSADAPPVLRAALRCDSGNDFAEGAKALGMGLWGDGGDLIEPTDAEAGAAVGRLLSDGYSPIVLGGDHAITRMVIPAVRSHMSHLDQPVATELASATDDGAVSDTVNAAVTAARRPLVCLQFDAHPDLYTELPCVSGADPRDSHAAQFTRLLEGPDPQIDLLIQVGIRTATTEQLSTADSFGVKMMTMGCTPLNGKSIGQWINNQVLAQFGDCDPPAAMYISMDLDGLDPAFAPAVAHIEPGGLSTRQVLDAIAEINAEIVAADVVELLPSADTANGITARVGAKIIREIAAAMIH